MQQLLVELADRGLGQFGDPKAVSQNGGLAGGYPGNTGLEVLVRGTDVQAALAGTQGFIARAGRAAASPYGLGSACADRTPDRGRG